jgi:hypothetical protein
VRLLSSQIGGNLECGNAEFLNSDGIAIYADSVSVSGDLVLNNHFLARGKVSVPSAHIGRNLDCSGARLFNASKPDPDVNSTALFADGIEVHGHARLSHNFRAEGRVVLSDAQVGGVLELDSGDFRKSRVELMDARVGELSDDETHWPSRRKLFLDGFAYNRIARGEWDAEKRLRWLALDAQFSMQPYRQLARVLNDAGDSGGATKVLIEMERQRGARSKGQLSWLEYKLKASIGYGYHPEYAILGLLACSAVGWVIYRRSHLAGNVLPIDKEAYEGAIRAGGALPPHYRRFSPLIYSLENSLPVMKFGQADYWHPGSQTSRPLLLRLLRDMGRGFAGLPMVPSATSKMQPFLRRIKRWGPQLASNALIGTLLRSLARLSAWSKAPGFTRSFLWLQILIGWLLVTLFLAALTGLVHKD